ncbi:MAG: hypothetical protein KKB50_13895 [Planctomycetes bacterium]|nr:hypothetical protein [Planctomycetota bacterium]
MRWGLFAVALLVTYLLQTAVVGHFGVPRAGFPVLDLFLVLGLTCGFARARGEVHASPGLASIHDARIAAWITGFAQDLASVGPLGIHAVALGLTAFIVTKLRVVVNERLRRVRLVVGFAAAVPAQVLLVVQQRTWSGAAALERATPVDPLWVALTSALLTALLAAAIAALITGALGLSRRRRRRYSPA